MAMRRSATKPRDMSFRFVSKSMGRLSRHPIWTPLRHYLVSRLYDVGTMPCSFRPILVGCGLGWRRNPLPGISLPFDGMPKRCRSSGIRHANCCVLDWVGGRLLDSAIGLFDHVASDRELRAMLADSIQMERAFPGPRVRSHLSAYGACWDLVQRFSWRTDHLPPALTINPQRSRLFSAVDVEQHGKHVTGWRRVKSTTSRSTWGEPGQRPDSSIN